MKYLAFTLSILTFASLSCKKNSSEIIEAGKKDGMIVTSHNVTIKGDFEDNESMQTIELDLDADDFIDLKFISTQDSGTAQFCGEYTQDELEEMEFEGGRFPITNTRVEMINGAFELAVQENSNRLYEVVSDHYEFEHPNGTASIYDVSYTKEQPDNDEGWEHFHTVRTFAKNETANENQLLTTYFGLCDMSNASYEYSMFYRDIPTDRLLGSITHFERNPLEVPSNELRYLVFKKGDKWGWVSFTITEENRITVVESAISKR